MADELPDWLAESSEPEPQKANSKAQEPKSKSYSPKTVSASNNLPLTPVQLAILGILGLILCGVLAGIGGMIFFARESLFGSPTQQVAALPNQDPTEAPPTPQPTATFTPSPTIALP